MGNDKRKRTKQTPDTDNSDFDENSQPPTTSTNDTSPQHFPRCILVESKEENRQITSVTVSNTKIHTEYRPASVAQLDTLSDWRPGGRGFNPRRGRQHFFRGD